MNNPSKKYLLDEWDYDKNGSLGITPKTVGKGSEKWVFWKCENGHFFDARVCDRTQLNRKSICKVCSGKMLVKGVNDFATLRPDLLKEWDFSRNKINPYDVGISSHEKVWWLCEKGHSYSAQIYHRTSKTKPTGCSVCSGRRILEGYNDLATLRPDLLKEWDYEENNKLGIFPNKITVSNDKLVYWKCSKGHSYPMQVYNKTFGKQSCSVCSNRRVLEGYNDLKSQYPELMKEWDYEKNNKLGIFPEKITFVNHSKVWWKCSKGHSWPAFVNVRTLQKTGCPKCSNQSSLGEVSLFLVLKNQYEDVFHRVKLFNLEYDIYVKDINLVIEYDGWVWHKDKLEKDLIKQKKAEDKGLKFCRIIVYQDKNIEDIKKNKNLLQGCLLVNESSLDRKNVYYLCCKIIKTLYKSKFISQSIKVDENIEALSRNYLDNVEYKNSLEYKFPKIAKEWHPTKNGELKPTNVSFGSGYEAWWVCPNGHPPYQAAVTYRTRDRQSGCPICANKKILSGYNDFATKYPDLAKWWDSEKNKIKPNEIAVSSQEEIYFKCPKGHPFHKKLADFMRWKTCPVCTNSIVIKGINDITTTHPEYLKYWDYERNAELGYFPENYFSGSVQSVYWKCENGYSNHNYSQKISDKIKRGAGCPICKNKKVIVGVNDLATTMPAVLKYWDYEKNTIKPTEITKNSQKEVWWIKNGKSIRRRVCSVCEYKEFRQG